MLSFWKKRGVRVVWDTLYIGYTGICVGVRGKETHVNQVPQREQEPITSLLLGNAKKSYTILQTIT